MAKRNVPLWLERLASLKVAITAMAVLMVLVVFCTLAQVKLGTFGAVEVYMRRWFVWLELTPGFSLPVFPGGALCGAVLLVNLVAALVVRFRWEWKKAGLWMAHGGLVLLVAGEFVTGAFQKETQLTFEEGQTLNFVESPREMEVTVVDTTDPKADRIFHVPLKLLKEGRTVAVAGTPLVLTTQTFHANAELSSRTEQDGPGPTLAGIGGMVKVRPLPRVSHDQERNLPAALVAVKAGGEGFGTWLLSPSLGAPQGFTHEGRTWRLALGPLREYLPFSLTLKDFRHDVYPGTTIPKNFSSLVRLKGEGADRDVLISMNQPLRFGGKAFYQASFGKENTLSVLQVVENPGWLLPYLSCTILSLGLLLHFGLMLGQALRREGAPDPEA